MELEDAYRTLGVEPGTEMKAVKAAWRAIAKEYHPDLHGDRKGSHERMVVANESLVRIQEAQPWEVEELRRRNTAREPPERQRDVQEPPPATEVAPRTAVREPTWTLLMLCPDCGDYVMGEGRGDMVIRMYRQDGREPHVCVSARRPRATPPYTRRRRRRLR